MCLPKSTYHLPFRIAHGISKEDQTDASLRRTKDENNNKRKVKRRTLLSESGSTASSWKRRKAQSVDGLWSTTPDNKSSTAQRIKQLFRISHRDSDSTKQSGLSVHSRDKTHEYDGDIMPDSPRSIASHDPKKIHWLSAPIGRKHYPRDKPYDLSDEEPVNDLSSANIDSGWSSMSPLQQDNPIPPPPPPRPFISHVIHRRVLWAQPSPTKLEDALDIVRFSPPLCENPSDRTDEREIVAEVHQDIQSSRLTEAPISRQKIELVHTSPVSAVPSHVLLATSTPDSPTQVDGYSLADISSVDFGDSASTSTLVGCTVMDRADETQSQGHLSCDEDESETGTLSSSSTDSSYTGTNRFNPKHYSEWNLKRHEHSALIAAVRRRPPHNRPVRLASKEVSVVFPQDTGLRGPIPTYRTTTEAIPHDPDFWEEAEDSITPVLHRKQLTEISHEPEADVISQSTNPSSEPCISHDADSPGSNRNNVMSLSERKSEGHKDSVLDPSIRNPTSYSGRISEFPQDTSSGISLQLPICAVKPSTERNVTPSYSSPSTDQSLAHDGTEDEGKNLMETRPTAVPILFQWGAPADEIYSTISTSSFDTDRNDGHSDSNIHKTDLGGTHQKAVQLHDLDEISDENEEHHLVRLELPTECHRSLYATNVFDRSTTDTSIQSSPEHHLIVGKVDDNDSEESNDPCPPEQINSCPVIEESRPDVIQLEPEFLSGRSQWYSPISDHGIKFEAQGRDDIDPENYGSNREGISLRSEIQNRPKDTEGVYPYSGVISVSDKSTVRMNDPTLAHVTNSGSTLPEPKDHINQSGTHQQSMMTGMSLNKADPVHVGAPKDRDFDEMSKTKDDSDDEERSRKMNATSNANLPSFPEKQKKRNVHGDVNESSKEVPAPMISASHGEKLPNAYFSEVETLNEDVHLKEETLMKCLPRDKMVPDAVEDEIYGNSDNIRINNFQSEIKVTDMNTSDQMKDGTHGDCILLSDGNSPSVGIDRIKTPTKIESARKADGDLLNNQPHCDTISSENRHLPLIAGKDHQKPSVELSDSDGYPSYSEKDGADKSDTNQRGTSTGNHKMFEVQSVNDPILKRDERNRGESTESVHPYFAVTSGPTEIAPIMNDPTSPRGENSKSTFPQQKDHDSMAGTHYPCTITGMPRDNSNPLQIVTPQDSEFDDMTITKEYSDDAETDRAVMLTTIPDSPSFPETSEKIIVHRDDDKSPIKMKQTIDVPSPTPSSSHGKCLPGEKTSYGDVHLREKDLKMDFPQNKTVYDAPHFEYPSSLDAVGYGISGNSKTLRPNIVRSGEIDEESYGTSQLEHDTSGDSSLASNENSSSVNSDGIKSTSTLEPTRDALRIHVPTNESYHANNSSAIRPLPLVAKATDNVTNDMLSTMPSMSAQKVASPQWTKNVTDQSIASRYPNESQGSLSKNSEAASDLTSQLDALPSYHDNSFNQSENEAPPTITTSSIPIIATDIHQGQGNPELFNQQIQLTRSDPSSSESDGDQISDYTNDNPLVIAIEEDTSDNPTDANLEEKGETEISSSKLSEHSGEEKLIPRPTVRTLKSVSAGKKRPKTLLKSMASDSKNLTDQDERNKTKDPWNSSDVIHRDSLSIDYDEHVPTSLRSEDHSPRRGKRSREPSLTVIREEPFLDNHAVNKNAGTSSNNPFRMSRRSSDDRVDDLLYEPTTPASEIIDIGSDYSSNEQLFIPSDHSDATTLGRDGNLSSSAESINEQMDDSSNQGPLIISADQLIDSLRKISSNEPDSGYMMDQLGIDSAGVMLITDPSINVSVTPGTQDLTTIRCEEVSFQPLPSIAPNSESESTAVVIRSTGDRGSGRNSPPDGSPEAEGVRTSGVVIYTGDGREVDDQSLPRRSSCVDVPSSSQYETGTSSSRVGSVVAHNRPHHRSGSLALLTSVFNFVTAYVPRHVHWFYMATFESREELLNAMAERSLRVAIVWNHLQTGLHNPVWVAAIFLGITSVSSQVRRIPELANQLVQNSDLSLLTPPYWVDRPILSHLSLLTQSVRNSPIWLGQAVATRLPNQPWFVLNPLD